MNERFARYIDPKRTDSENRFDDVSLIFFFFFVSKRTRWNSRTMSTTFTLGNFERNCRCRDLSDRDERENRARVEYS